LTANPLNDGGGDVEGVEGVVRGEDAFDLTR
jgi:hypothetical protein